MQNVYIRKAKILKTPKLDLGKLLESHGEIETVRCIRLSSGVHLTHILICRPLVPRLFPTSSNPRFRLPCKWRDEKDSNHLVSFSELYDTIAHGFLAYTVDAASDGEDLHKWKPNVLGGNVKRWICFATFLHRRQSEQLYGTVDRHSPLSLTGSSPVRLYASPEEAVPKVTLPA